MKVIERSEEETGGNVKRTYKKIRNEIYRIFENRIEYEEEITIRTKEREFDYILFETFENTVEEQEIKREGVEIRDNRVYYYYYEDNIYEYLPTDLEPEEFMKEITKINKMKNENEIIEEIEAYIDLAKNNMYIEEDLMEEAASLMNTNETYISYPEYTDGEIVVYNEDHSKKIAIGFHKNNSNYYYHPDELVVETVE